jgi:O-acetyl-ADP-ribose deacetylase (regulator of RNase III)
MPFDIIRQDISLMDVDAIVSAVDHELSLGRGVSQSIHEQAGHEYSEELRRKGTIYRDEVFVTSGYNLRAKYVFHTLTPQWEGGFSSEVNQLAQCYEQLCDHALRMNVHSIAFPLLSSGNQRFPKDKALKVAMSALQRFVLSHDMQVYLVVFDFSSYFMSLKLATLVENYLHKNFDARNYEREENMNYFNREITIESSQVQRTRQLRLEDRIAQTSHTFSQRLIRLIDERKLSDSEVYHKANIDRRLFSKIRSNDLYQPSKATVIAFAIALELNIDETKDLLRSAGYALSNSQKFDVIIEFFIQNHKYNIYEINETLFHYKLPSLG